MTFAAHAENYKLVRQPGDLNLILEIRQALVEAGLLQEVQQAFDTNHYILDGLEKIPEVQRYLLNRFWNLQLLSVQNVCSLEERFCLVPDGQPQDWLRLFREKILPFAVQHRLPRNF